MKIAVPLARTSISGGTRIALQYAEELAKCGHAVVLLFPKDTRFDFFSLPANVITIPLDVPRRIRRLLGGIADILSIARSIPVCDVILCNSWQMVFPALLSHATRRGSRIVHLIQHLDSVIIAEKPWLVRWQNIFLSTLVYRLPIQKIVVSSWLKEAVWRIAKQPATCVPNGVNTAAFIVNTAPHWEPARETIDILVTGRLARWKGYNDVVEAVRLLASSNPRIRLVVASRENVPLPSDYPCVLVRPSNDKELGTLYQKCSVFVMASWCEGFGLPALEAMALGAPVVTTDCCGINDFARHGINCLVVPPRQPAELAQAIETILRDPILSLRLSKAGQETGRVFTTRRMAEGLLTALKAPHDY